MQVVSERSSKALNSALDRVKYLPRPTSIANKSLGAVGNYDDYSDSVYVDSPYDDYSDYDDAPDR